MMQAGNARHGLASASGRSSLSTSKRETSMGTRSRILVVAAVVVGFLVSGATAQAATQMLPDLQLARLQDLRVVTSNGQRLLKYSTIIVNKGRGRFELHGQRSSTTGDMSATQRIFDDTGGAQDVPTTATMYFAGDGHNHWHTRDLETGTLNRLDNGVKVGALAKHGFCFSDNYRFGSASSVFYSSCGGNPSAFDQVMGLSVGWGDIYGWNTVDQWINITSVGNGRYRLSTTANPNLGFREVASGNNTSWVDIRLQSNSVKVQNAGGYAVP